MADALSGSKRKGSTVGVVAMMRCPHGSICPTQYPHSQKGLVAAGPGFKIHSKEAAQAAF